MDHEAPGDLELWTPDTCRLYMERYSDVCSYLVALGAGLCSPLKADRIVGKAVRRETEDCELVQVLYGGDAGQLVRDAVRLHYFVPT